MASIRRFAPAWLGYYGNRSREGWRFAAAFLTAAAIGSRSPFSFWGQRGGLRGWMMQPFAGASGFFSPMFSLFTAMSLSLFWKTRGRTPRALALVTAAIAIGASLLKIHPTGTFVAWAYPFLLLSLFA